MHGQQNIKLISLLIRPCVTISSLVSSSRSSAHLTVRIPCPPNYEVSKLFMGYLDEVLTVQYEQNLRPTASLSNSSSNLSTSCLPLVQSYCNILIHAQFASLFPFGGINTGSLQDLH